MDFLLYLSSQLIQTQKRKHFFFYCSSHAAVKFSSNKHNNNKTRKKKSRKITNEITIAQEVQEYTQKIAEVNKEEKSEWIN